ncbi:hypothetical protein EDD16DRAFT_1588503, partial [Pisolithus croceorrhizus]
MSKSSVAEASTPEEWGYAVHGTHFDTLVKIKQGLADPTPSCGPRMEAPIYPSIIVALVVKYCAPRHPDRTRARLGISTTCNYISAFFSCRFSVFGHFFFMVLPMYSRSSCVVLAFSGYVSIIVFVSFSL